MIVLDDTLAADLSQYVEFSDADFTEDDALSLPSPNPHAMQNASLGRSLENLLVSKNRRLLEDLTKLRVSFEDLSVLSSKNEEAAEGLKVEVSRLKGLNEKLENDLMGLNKDVEGYKIGGGGSSAGLAGLDIGSKPVCPSGTPTWQYTDAQVQDGRSTPQNGDASILPIVTSQRDRFRQRNAELEEELRKQFDTISDLRAEIKSLQADNLKLYEKVRYMQSYKDGTAGGSGGGGYGNGNGNGNGVGGPSTGGAGILNGVMNRGREDEIGRYKDKYEESMNPFEAFKGRVSHYL
jgi:homeobox protein cut-like